MTETDRDRNRQTDGQTQTPRLAGRQADRQTDGLTGRHRWTPAHSHTHTSMYLCMYGWRVCVGRGMQGWLGNCGAFKVEGHRGFGARRADVRRSQGEAAVTRLNLPNA